ncbi:hypothetical protein [uncultured Treponema sp.]|uniref:hypothetical protein n=1 Tax=uncultured Treponema sp. TaxID=162155 RepID=UPI002591D729|nr:hypothetical protein [uncultured Treponema sp.]
MEIFDDENQPEIRYDENDLVFHYKRGSFRRHEQAIYRDLATGKNAPKKGLIKVLFSTKGNKIAFFTMVMCIVLFFVLGIVNGGADKNSIAGMTAKISAFSFDEKIYASVEFSNLKKMENIDSVPLKVTFECLNAEGSVADIFETDFNFAPRFPKPVYAVFNDYDLVSVKCRLIYESESAVLECKISNR